MPKQLRVVLVLLEIVQLLMARSCFFLVGAGRGPRPMPGQRSALGHAPALLSATHIGEGCCVQVPALALSDSERSDICGCF